MNSASQQTYLPDAPDEVAAVFDFLAAHEKRGGDPPARRYRLAGPNPGEEVEIPEHVYMILRDVVDAMRRNLAITVVPQTTTLTTQQAAELLGVSRPTIVKYLEQGRIPFQRVGTHRKVLLADLVEFRQRRREEQYAFLAETELGDDVGPDEAVTLTRRARRARSGSGD